jgi:FtsP/CotA-like multicopper oxidase with cupredoxin domain
MYKFHILGKFGVFLVLFGLIAATDLIGTGALASRGVFADPVEMPDINPDPGIVEVNLSAQIATVDVDGTQAQLMTYNGYFPGPTIRVHRGDSLRIHFTNNLPYTTETNILGYRKNLTNLHTHGMHVSPEAPLAYVMY